ncbi:hypothetical protein [Halobaculum limi]|uniref:hypothetical protein n=1 Tax=Halobaculum limi TaxID=3031916 RepID=UPI0024057055|nr:hypothetical protein [Halobaculum sp. YSMS11]
MTDPARRSVLRLAGVAGIGSLAGCVSFGNSDGIDVDAVSESDERHVVTAITSGDFGPIAEATTLTPDETETLEDMVPVLDYAHTFTVQVVLDGSVVADEQYVLREIPGEDDPFRVVVEGPGSVSLDIPEPTASPTPEE